MTLSRVLLLALLALVLPACATTPTQGDKQLNHQNKEAGEFVEKTATDPTIIQAGKDVKENSTVLEKNLIGPPEKPQPYSPKASEKARDDSTQEHSTPWYMELLKMGVGFLLGGGAVQVLAKFAPFLAMGPVAKIAAALKGLQPVQPALETMVEAVARTREKAAANGGSITIDTLLAELSKLQGPEGSPIRELIRKVAHKKEAELAAKL